MKIRIISDLHQEFGLTEFSFAGADVIILAGDIHMGTKGVEWIKSRVKTIPVMYVLGNHEYYKGAYPKTRYQITEAAQGSNIFVLENKAVTLDGITFHGATLWTNFELFGNPMVSGSICQEKMNDYKQIRRTPSYSKLRSVDTYHIHQASIQWLTNSLETSSTKQNIVVTHHAPSRQSIPPIYKNDVVSSAYASDLEGFILQHQPNYWVHGHIHKACRYHIGATEVICNPYGYIHEKDEGFDPDLMIEVLG